MKSQLLNTVLLTSLVAFSANATAEDTSKRDADASLGVFAASIFNGYQRVTPEVKDAKRNVDASTGVFLNLILGNAERVTPAARTEVKSTNEASKLFTSQFETKRTAY